MGDFIFPWAGTAGVKPQEGGKRVLLYGIDSVKAKLYRPLEGRLKTATVKREDRPCWGSPWGSASCLEVGVRIRIEIGNRRQGVDGHYVGRPSPLGNPFRLRSETERDNVVAKYAAWLEARLQEGDEAVRRELNRLYMEAVRKGSLRLLCWCSPRRCHAEVIAQKLAAVLRDRGHEVEVVYL